MIVLTTTKISLHSGAFPGFPNCIHLLVTLLITVIGAQVIHAQPPKVVSSYLHDGRCFTLEDTVEYFNLIQQLRLLPEEKKDLVAFLRCL